MNTLTTTNQDQTVALEKAVLEGDLSKLSEAERLIYYKKTCESLGLNPLTKPFQYIKLNGQLKLYVTKDATEQLRKLNHISIPAEKIEIWEKEGYVFCRVSAYTKDGRSDTDIGSVKLQGTTLDNAYKKALTQAKRRATLSICGLGMLEESDIASIPQSAIEIVPTPELETRYCNGKESAILTKILKEERGVDDTDITVVAKMILNDMGYGKLGDVPLNEFDAIREAFEGFELEDLDNG